MATRQLFLVTNNNFVKKVDIEFKWYPGLSISQKQKSISSLHMIAILKKYAKKGEILEISTKSPLLLGKNLSAFNLKTKTKAKGIDFSVESAYQSGKVFIEGGPYKDILKLDSRKAKKDPRLKNSGDLIYFSFFGRRFELSQGSAFYDWVYINVLLKNPKLCNQILKYKAFTDIEFLSSKSKSTQAFSAAMFVALQKQGVDMENFNNPDIFLEKTKEFYEKFLLNQ